MRRLDLGKAMLSALGYTSRDVPTKAGAVRIADRRGPGTLPPIVVIHGLGSRGADYLPLLQRLSRHSRRVIAPDLPGHGASETPSALDIASCIEGVGEAIDATLDEPAIVFGNSLGGLTSLRFALAYPRRVRGLFLTSPAGAPSTPAELAEIAAKLRIKSHEDALRFFEIVLHEKPGPLRHAVAWSLRRRYGTSGLRALLGDIEKAKPLEPEELAKLEVPVHLFWGRSERLLPPSHLAFFRQHLRGATIEEPYGFGHSPDLDSVNDVARRIIAFARDH
jgi:pimeloyl-ACP methyl ester carboxylesterase